MKGTKANFESNENHGSVITGGAHDNASYVKDIIAATAVFLKDGNNSKQFIKDFIEMMKNKFGIIINVIQ
jgi:hypothetical protein